MFLQDIKSTADSHDSIFVSIIGTFAVMSLIGFSINLLTLFALVLAIGTVVTMPSWWWKPCRRSSTRGISLRCLPPMMP